MAVDDMPALRAEAGDEEEDLLAEALKQVENGKSGPIEAGRVNRTGIWSAWVCWHRPISATGAAFYQALRERLGAAGFDVEAWTPGSAAVKRRRARLEARGLDYGRLRELVETVVRETAPEDDPIRELVGESDLTEPQRKRRDQLLAFFQRHGHAHVPPSLSHPGDSPQFGLARWLYGARRREAARDGWSGLKFWLVKLGALGSDALRLKGEVPLFAPARPAQLASGLAAPAARNPSHDLESGFVNDAGEIVEPTEPAQPSSGFVT